MKIIEPKNPSNKDKVKQFRERAIFTAFAKLASEVVPDAIWEQVDSGGPDFIRDDGSLGVELTDLLRDVEDKGSKAMAQAAYWNRILQVAIKEKPFEGIGYRIIAYPDLRKEIKPDDIETIAAALTDFLGKNMPSETTMLHNFGRMDNQDLPKHFSSIQVRRFDDGTPAQGLIADEANAAVTTVQMIQDRIDEKNEKVEDYKKRAKEPWLLIVIEGFKYSSWLFLGSCLNQIYETSFFRVFIYEVAGNRFHELELSK